MRDEVAGSLAVRLVLVALHAALALAGRRGAGKPLIFASIVVVLDFD